MDNLPVIEKEIGDAWIHGIGTDHKKLSRYRNVLRTIEGMDLSGIELSDSALIVPEHTWGMDIKKHFKDECHWTHFEMEEVENERIIIEKSWQEQRDYVLKAEEKLGITPEYPINKPILNEYEVCTDWDDVNFEISWQLFSNEDYKIYEKEYLKLTDSTRYWVLWDNTKIGLPHYEGKILTAKIKEAYNKNQEMLYLMAFDDDETKKYGLPYFYVQVNDYEISIKWFDKKNSRLPQAFWFKIKDLEEKWEINKLGQWIDPDEIIARPLICAVDKGVRNSEYLIEPLNFYS